LSVTVIATLRVVMATAAVLQAVVPRMVKRRSTNENEMTTKSGSTRSIRRGQ